MQTCHPNPSMPPLMQLKLCPSVLCLLLFLVAASMHDIQSCCAAEPCCFPCCKDTAGKKQHALSPARKTLGPGSFCFPSLWLSCQHTKIVSPLSNEPMPQMKKAPETGTFYEYHIPDGYLKSSRSCTLALSVRSSTSTPLGGVNWKVPLPSMTSGMNLVKFTSL